MNGTAAVVLAAGLSRRFGPKDKLDALVRQQPLIAHAVAVARRVGPSELACVVRPGGAAERYCRASGVTALRNPSPSRGLGRSVAMAARWARARGAARLLLLLGDMAEVPPVHLRRLENRCRRTGSACTTLQGVRQVPACFGRAWLGDIGRLGGEEGARGLLLAVPEAGLVPAPAAWLRDVDRPADLRRLRAAGA